MVTHRKSAPLAERVVYALTVPPSMGETRLKNSSAAAEIGTVMRERRSSLGPHCHASGDRSVRAILSIPGRAGVSTAFAGNRASHPPQFTPRRNGGGVRVLTSGKPAEEIDLRAEPKLRKTGLTGNG
jgi:hypothetical protein